MRVGRGKDRYEGVKLTHIDPVVYRCIANKKNISTQTLLKTICKCENFLKDFGRNTFLPEASFGLRVLSSAVSVGLWSVCVCINHELVRTITHRSFTLGSPDWDQRFKTPRFRTLLFFGMIDIDLQGQIWLENQSLPHFEIVCNVTHQPFKLESLNLDQKCILSLLRLVLIFTFIFNPKTYFSVKSFCTLFVLYLVRPSLVNISETIAGDRSNQFGLLTEDKFCSKLSMGISIDSRYCNRFINFGRPIFPLNHSGASAATVFTIPTTFGIAHARCYTRAERAAQSATQVWSSLLDSLTVPSTHHVHKIVFTFSPICCACANSIAIYSIITRYFIFSASARTSHPPFLLVGCDSWCW